jgi:hypothetical protein
MNDRQNAKLSMAERVLDVLKRYEAAYAALTPVAEAAAALRGNVADIVTTTKERGAVSVAAASLEKREAETRMVEGCVRHAAALYVLGFTTGSAELAPLQGVTEHSFYHLEDNAKLAQALRVLDLVRAHAAALAPYGVTEADVEAVAAAVEAYRALIAMPMDAIGERKQKTASVAQLFAALDSTLYDRLDKLMVLFKQAQPDFYGEYRTARNLILR